MQISGFFLELINFRLEMESTCCARRSRFPFAMKLGCSQLGWRGENQIKFHSPPARHKSKGCGDYLFAHLQLRETPNKKAIIRALPIQTVFFLVCVCARERMGRAGFRFGTDSTAALCHFIMRVIERAARREVLLLSESGVELNGAFPGIIPKWLFHFLSLEPFHPSNH